jgi:rRNA maturation protein Nop10
MKWMKKCPVGPHYTLHDICPVHGVPASNPHPPKFDPLDKNGAARRKAKGLA